MNEFASLEAVLSGFRDMMWFPVALPLIAALPCVSDFYESWFGGSYYMLLSRKSRFRYAVDVLIKAALTSFFSVFAGCLLYAFMAGLKFPLLSSMPIASFESYLLYETDGTVFLKALFSVLHTSYVTSVLSVFSLILVLLLKDPFFAVSIPVLLEYLSIKVNEILGIYIYKNYMLSHMDVPAKVLGFSLLLPSEHLTMDQVFYYNFSLPYFIYFLGMLALMLLLCVIFIILVKRRNE